jgi:NADH:ubiquinone oxidoreductase subunit K/uncharacterized MnhB-related membrane protein
MKDTAFYLVAGIMLALSAGVVMARNILHAALYLIFTLSGTALLYLFMNAEFAAIAQVLVYIGGIVIVVVFTILLTSQLGEQHLESSAPRRIVSAPARAGLPRHLRPFAVEPPRGVCQPVAHHRPLRVAGPGGRGAAGHGWHRLADSVRADLAAPAGRRHRGDCAGPARPRDPWGGEEVNLTSCLVLSFAMFAIGLYGVLTRRHLIGILMCIELMLNAANMNFIAFAHFTHPEPTAGAVFSIFVMAVSACEMAVALSIVVAMYRQSKTLDGDRMTDLKG